MLSIIIEFICLIIIGFILSILFSYIIWVYIRNLVGYYTPVTFKSLTYYVKYVIFPRGHYEKDK